MQKKITQYGSVGALGTVTNMTIFSILTFLNAGHNFSSTLAFLVSVTQNYQLNKRWTFKDHNTKVRKKFIKYIILNLFSFLINLLVLNIVVETFGTERSTQILGQLLGIALAMSFNFIGSYLIVFAKYKEDENEQKCYNYSNV